MRRNTKRKVADPVREIDLGLMDKDEQIMAHRELSGVDGTIGKLAGSMRTLNGLRMGGHRHLGRSLPQVLREALEARRNLDALIGQVQVLTRG